MAFPEINRLVLVARLTHKPELGELPSGRSVCNARVATNGVRYDEDEEGYVQRPNFFDVAVYGPQAENLVEYTSRGSQIVIDGRLEWYEWVDDDDQDRQGVRIVADSVQFVGEPKPSSTGRGRAKGSSRATGSRARTAPGRARPAGRTRRARSTRK